MKICVAQTRPVKGDIESNINKHKELISLAVSNGADTIVFPELSLTGYEPTLSKKLATHQDDPRLDDFQKISDNDNVTIAVGLPTKSTAGILISMIIFEPGKPRQTYSKQHIHSDEYPYFVNGQEQIFLNGNENKIAPAICYELSVAEHSENAFKNGAKIYVASVAKSVDGIDKAIKSLSEIATKYAMTVLMSNCIGLSDGFECAGKSSVWNDRGTLVRQLNGTQEGIIVIDTDTQEVFEETI